jgi:hypothetical protein
MWKTAGRRLPGRSRLRWQHNIKMDLKGIGWKGVEFVHMAQDGEKRQSVLNRLTHLQVP